MRVDGPRRAQGRCEHSGTLWAVNKALRTWTQEEMKRQEMPSSLSTKGTRVLRDLR